MRMAFPPSPTRARPTEKSELVEDNNRGNQFARRRLRWYPTARRLGNRFKIAAGGGGREGEATKKREKEKAIDDAASKAVAAAEAAVVRSPQVVTAASAPFPAIEKEIERERPAPRLD